MKFSSTALRSNTLVKHPQIKVGRGIQTFARLVLTLVVLACSNTQDAELVQYDLAFNGGRVIDPDLGLTSKPMSPLMVEKLQPSLSYHCQALNQSMHQGWSSITGHPPVSSQSGSKTNTGPHTQRNAAFFQVASEQQRKQSKQI
ncbi:MAG: hypothetical protein ACJA0W_002061 [Candidatus Azotimanducaceae bacterium]|jgi:hypothetical protein